MDLKIHNQNKHLNKAGYKRKIIMHQISIFDPMLKHNDVEAFRKERLRAE